VIADHTWKGKRLLGVPSPEHEAVDLDTEEQWQALQARLAHEAIGSHSGH
jgi:hypothetical protein